MHVRHKIIKTEVDFHKIIFIALKKGEKGAMLKYMDLE
jgi:hypothetical protein